MRKASSASFPPASHERPAAADLDGARAARLGARLARPARRGLASARFGAAARARAGLLAYQAVRRLRQAAGPGGAGPREAAPAAARGARAGRLHPGRARILRAPLPGAAGRVHPAPRDRASGAARARGAAAARPRAGSVRRIGGGGHHHRRRAPGRAGRSGGAVRGSGARCARECRGARPWTRPGVRGRSLRGAAGSSALSSRGGEPTLRPRARRSAPGAGDRRARAAPGVVRRRRRPRGGFPHRGRGGKLAGAGRFLRHGDRPAPGRRGARAVRGGRIRARAGGEGSGRAGTAPGGQERELMDAIEIDGGIPLRGDVEVSGSKNATLPQIAAALLAPGRSVFRNVPDLADIRTMARLLSHMGAQVSRDAESGGHTLEIDAAALPRPEAPYELVKTMRASVLVLGPLVARLGRARVSLPGGCAIGARPIDQHLKGLAVLGARIELEHGYVEASAKRLHGATVLFDLPTVTGTENLLMAAVVADGRSVL